MKNIKGLKMTLVKLKEFRKELKISLLELAATTGLPQGYLEKIEAGEIPVLENDLKRIEAAIRTIAKDPHRLEEADS
jgi:predicted transcriptional regulator